MQDFIGSVCRSLVFKPSDDGGVFGGFVEKIGSIIRKSGIGLFLKPPVPALPPIAKSDAIKVKKDDAPIAKSAAIKVKKDDAPTIQWRKGELIGCGSFGRVYMGLNIDSGALLAIKQVSIAGNSASKEKTQAHFRELEEEVNLLENLSHPNIIRYLGTTREEASLNILLEIVPGGSISSLLGKFGSFPESVIRMYTKQLLLGVEYLHRNGIMHRDIKGANILVDNKGCIKLTDFGASKKVVELATMTGAKSMKGTPYWMAPEVILQTGHSFSADIWSVGCTVIEMATGKPPWSQQYQEVAALLHIGTTKSYPPIPEHLSAEATDFLLKCLQKEPNLRPAASDLLQHPFVTREYQETYPVLRASVMENSGKKMATPEMELKNSMDPIIRTTHTRLKDVHNSVRCSTIYPKKFPGNVPHWGSGNCDDDMCQIDDEDDLVIGASAKFDFTLLSDDFNKSFNPMSEPDDNWPCKSDDTPELESRVNLLSGQTVNKATDIPRASGKGNNDFTFPSGPLVAEDDDDDNEGGLLQGLEVDYSGSGNCDDDMCQIDDEDDLVIGASAKFDSALLSDDFNKSLNPMSEPDDNCLCKSDDTPELESRVNLFSGQIVNKSADIPQASGKGNNDFTFPCGPLVAEDDDDEVVMAKYVSSKEEVDALDSFCIQPVDLNYFFKDGKIYDYQGLKITIWVSSISFHAYAEIIFQSTSDGGKGDYRSEICSPGNHGPPIQNITNGHNSDSNSYLKTDCSDLEVIQVVVGTMPVGHLYSRLVPLVLILVDGSNPIDITDPRCEILLIVQKKIDLQGGNQLRLLGFRAIYHFYHYPNSLCLRLSQVVFPNQNPSMLLKMMYMCPTKGKEHQHKSKVQDDKNGTISLPVPHRRKFPIWFSLVASEYQGGDVPLPQISACYLRIKCTNGEASRIEMDENQTNPE
ncbi:Mitogen-activated protein kinase kinase kinase NPK1 [Camellia lanceoleosa]|uniref:Mitogen-activated protein kinase kinase kinase NPK1 n=1 Tax=Camellia lanceoleosa TaxID=1840588 RepID=A0ACC0GT08_9ERIC|nr:Mitogen-activated protein kinase kinase kinase NPK1 [Camellia lanceoleosa]